MDPLVVIVGALIAAAFIALIVALCRGHVELLSSFPQDPETLSLKDRKSMGRGVAAVLVFIAVVLIVVLAVTIGK